MNDCWGDFRQRFEGESPFVHEGVRNEQFLAREDLIAEEEQIEIDRAGNPLVAALPAHFLLDFEESMEQCMGTQGGLNLDGGIEEWRGVLVHSLSGVFEK